MHQPTSGLLGNWRAALIDCWPNDKEAFILTRATRERILAWWILCIAVAIDHSRKLLAAGDSCYKNLHEKLHSVLWLNVEHVRKNTIFYEWLFETGMMFDIIFLRSSWYTLYFSCWLFLLKYHEHEDEILFKYDVSSFIWNLFLLEESRKMKLSTFAQL